MATRKTSTTSKTDKTVSPAPKTPAKPEASKPAQPAAPIDRASRKVRVGVVVSDKMTKTVVVRVDNMVKHHLYPKIIRTANTLKVHDPESAAKAGDVVVIMETRPLSKTKRWRLVEVLRRASGAPAVPDAESTS